MALTTGQVPPAAHAANPRGTRASADRRRFGEPAYLHIANTIEERIGAGDYHPGDQLPTEGELRAEFGVSPMTVRRAINILLDRNLVTTTQGKGTFVRTLELGEAVFRLQPITEVLDDESVDVSLLEAGIIPADEKMAALLECSAGDHLIRMRRLIARDGAPLMYQLEQLVYDEHRPLVEAQLQLTSLNGLLRSAPGEGMPRGDLAIEAVCLKEDEARFLGVPLGSPAFCLEHLFYDFDGRPVSWGRLLCRADKFRLLTHLGAPPPGSDELP
jgi:GntR family transcriptional regulator